MALTESQKLDIAMILGVTYIDVNDKITNLGTNYITAEVETKIADELTRWTTAGVNFTAIEPNIANFGARINPNSEREQIKQRLAGLLYFTELSFGGNNWGRSNRS